jgi:plasmid maintenance system antidote protein VapI
MTTPTPSISLRTEQLEKYRALSGLTTATALAARMGVHESTVRRVLSGDVALSTDFVARLLGTFPSLEFADLFTVTTERVA